MSTNDPSSNNSAEATPPAPGQGPPLRALAMVLISLAILFATLGIFSLTGAGSSEPSTAAAAATSTAAPAAAATTAAPPSTEASTTTDASTSGASTTATTSAAAGADSIRVLNNSNVAGLAATTAATLESSGFTVAETGNYSGGTLEQTAVYYEESSPTGQAQAERIAASLGVTALPRFAGIADAPPGVIVIVTE